MRGTPEPPSEQHPSGRPLSFAAVLFDLDGVLVDSMHIVRMLWQQWAAERGLDPAVVKAASKGSPGIETLRRLDPHMDVETEAQRLSELEHSYVDRVTPMPGALEMLASLAASGVPWGIVTSGTRLVARGRIVHCGIPEPMTLVTADDVERGKPDAAPYLLGANRLGVPAHGCLVVEDSPGGVTAGRAAGATVVGLVGSHPPDRLSAAHIRIERLADLNFEQAPRGVALAVGTRL